MLGSCCCCSAAVTERRLLRHRPDWLCCCLACHAFNQPCGMRCRPSRGTATAWRWPTSKPRCSTSRTRTRCTTATATRMSSPAWRTSVPRPYLATSLRRSRATCKAGPARICWQGTRAVFFILHPNSRLPSLSVRRRPGFTLQGAGHVIVSLQSPTSHKCFKAVSTAPTCRTYCLQCCPLSWRPPAYLGTGVRVMSGCAHLRRLLVSQPQVL